MHVVMSGAAGVFIGRRLFSSPIPPPVVYVCHWSSLFKVCFRSFTFGWVGRVAPLAPHLPLFSFNPAGLLHCRGYPTES